MPRVVVTLPAYRAEGTLEKTIADLPTGLADRLILVDDASPDRTVQLARELGIVVHVHPQNRGYGGNQKTCYKEALREGADVVVMLHPDYQYDPKAVPLLIAPILAGDADMTFGSRFAGLGDPMGGGMPLYRYLGNRLTTVLENFMLGTRFTETHSGLRAYNRKCLLSLPFLNYSNDFAFDSQFLVDAVTGGQRVVEVPIPTRYTKESSSISIVRSIKYIGQSLLYCARQAIIRGRRGRRWPVTNPGVGRGTRIPGETIEMLCTVCGHNRHVAVRERTTRGTQSGAMARKCQRCGYGVSVDPTSQKLPIVSTSQDFARSILHHASGYVRRGDRLVAIADDHRVLQEVSSELGWKARSVRPDQVSPVEHGGDEEGFRNEDAEPSRSADVAVLVQPIESLWDPVSFLRGLKVLLDEEGLVLLISRTARTPSREMDGGPLPARNGIRRALTPRAVRYLLTNAGYRFIGWQRFDRNRLSIPATNSADLETRASPGSRRVIPELFSQMWSGDEVLIAARPRGS